MEGIAYLRAGSRDRAEAALARLDRGDHDGALALLLAENDGWWDEPPPPEAIALEDYPGVSSRLRRLGVAL